MGAKMGAELLSDATIRAIAKDLRDLYNRPEPGIRVIPNEDNAAELQAEYEGPAGTPFEGGVFRMKLVLGHQFPEAPPKGYFLTKIFHPNISKTGEICVNVLKKDWKPELGLRHVLVVIRCLLIEPFAESALNEEAGKMLMESFEEFSKHAQLMTAIHAQPPRRPTVLTASGGANAVNSQDPAPSADLMHHPALESMAPPVKKPKGIEKSKPGLAGKKRSLKRL